MERKASWLFGFVLVLVFLVLVSVWPNQSLSHHRRQVLGDSTSSSQVVFPPVTAGAGFILPDSPLFFLDKTFQQIRLLLAFTPERRAAIGEQIAGERIAELRIMLSRNNPDGISIALSNLTKEVEQMSTNLSDAAASGKDVSSLAKKLNESVKTHGRILGILADQTDGTLKLQIKAAREALREAKVEIEDELDKDDLQDEIKDDIDDEIEEAVDEATGSARRLDRAIDVLTKLASEAAAKQQTRREEALRHAIEVKNDALRRQTEKFFEEDLKKQERLFEARKKAHDKAREAIEKAQKAVSEFKEANDEVGELKSQNNQESGSSGSGM